MNWLYICTLSKHSRCIPALKEPGCSQIQWGRVSDRLDMIQWDWLPYTKHLLGDWVVWGRVTADKITGTISLTMPEGSHLRGLLSTHTHTFNYTFCCGKQMTQLGLVEGVTSESDYSGFVRHCSIIFSPPQPQKLTLFQHSSLSKRRGSRKLPNVHYALFLFISLSLSLCCIRRGWRGEGEKVRGNKHEDTGVIRMHSSCRKTQAAFTTHWSCRELWLLDQDNLFSPSALQYFTT